MEFVYPMVSILLRAEFGLNDYREDAQHFTTLDMIHIYISMSENIR